MKQGNSGPVVMEERKEPLADAGDETAAAVAAAALASLGAAVVAMKEPRGGAQP